MTVVAHHNYLITGVFPRISAILIYRVMDLQIPLGTTHLAPSAPNIEDKFPKSVPSLILQLFAIRYSLLICIGFLVYIFYFSLYGNLTNGKPEKFIKRCFFHDSLYLFLYAI